MRRSLTFIPLLVMMALLLSALPAAARSNIAIGVSNPAGGGPDVTSVMAAVDAHTAAVGRKPALWSLWSKWGSRGANSNGPCVEGKGSCAFPTEAVEALQARGITPVIWWLPVDPKNPDGNRRYSQYKRILKGIHDEYIRDWARAARNVGGPVVVRFAHEATGHWFPWSIGRGTNTKTNYKKAWVRIWNKFRIVGANKNVRWMWANVLPVQWAYPGDKYVDYVGITVLNFGSDRTWRPGKRVVDSRAKASPKFTKKPIIIAELATSHKGGNKGSWVNDAYLRAYWKHPKVKGIMYLDTNEPKIQRGHPDWRLKFGDGGAGLKAYKKLARKSKFKGRIR